MMPHRINQNGSFEVEAPSNNQEDSKDGYMECQNLVWSRENYAGSAEDEELRHFIYKD